VKRWWVLLLIFAAGLTAGGVAVGLVTRGSGSKKTDVSATKGGSKVSGTTTGQDLAQRLATGKQSTFHVRYAFSAASGASLTMDVWNTPTRVRRDVLVVSPTEGTTHTAEFLDPDKYTQCVLVQGHPWQCVAQSTRQGQSLADPVNGVPHDVTGKTVTVTEDTIAGTPVKCYSVPAASPTAKPTQFCLSPENVPLRIDGGDGKPLNATNFDHDVPDSEFTPPAPVAGTA
jgi:hypothetical protein